MREIFLNIDSKVVLEDIEKPQRIAIVNPEALKDISAEKLWERISCLNILKFLKLFRRHRKNSCWSIKINYLYPKELAIVSHQPLTTKISW